MTSTTFDGPNRPNICDRVNCFKFYGHLGEHENREPSGYNSANAYYVGNTGQLANTSSTAINYTTNITDTFNNAGIDDLLEKRYLEYFFTRTDLLEDLKISELRSLARALVVIQREYR